MVIALGVADHIHHDAAGRWFSRRSDPFAMCPITEGALVRYLLRGHHTIADVRLVLESFRQDRRWRFWADDLSYVDVDLAGVVGHRQVTDAYLVGLARGRGGRVATFDRGLVAAYPDTAELVGA